MVLFEYKNWKGVTKTRKVKPRTIWFGSTECHPYYQWLLTAFDEDKQAERDFAMKDIKNWREV